MGVGEASKAGISSGLAKWRGLDDGLEGWLSWITDGPPPSRHAGLAIRGGCLRGAFA